MVCEGQKRKKAYVYWFRSNDLSKFTYHTKERYTLSAPTVLPNITVASYRRLLWVLLLRHSNVSSECYLCVIHMFPLKVNFVSYKCFLWMLLLRHSNDSLVCYICVTNQTFGLIPQSCAFEVEHIMIFKQYALLYCMDLLVRIHITYLLAKTNATPYCINTTLATDCLQLWNSETLKLCNSVNL